MNKQLEKVNIVPPADEPSNLPVAVTPMAMLEKAVANGAGLDMVEKLMGLQERWEKNQARKAFDEAIAAAKLEIPAIERNAKGHNEKSYANFAAIAKTVDPILGKHGLSYRFKTTQGERISVTCILSHKAGHFEETTLSGPADSSGNKNAIQAIGSTLTYLQRYSLVQMLGLAAANDDDGKGASAEPYTPPEGSLSPAQLEELRMCLHDKGATEKAFIAWAKVKRIEDIPSERFAACKTAIANFRKG